MFKKLFISLAVIFCLATVPVYAGDVYVSLKGSLGTTEKFLKLSLISGGKTSICIFLHSSIKSAILSKSLFSDVSKADINSTGKCVFR